jgi:hypothetical protein
MAAQLVCINSGGAGKTYLDIRGLRLGALHLPHNCVIQPGKALRILQSLCIRYEKKARVVGDLLGPIWREEGKGKG